jgi:hypothetical protein
VPSGHNVSPVAASHWACRASLAQHSSTRHAAHLERALLARIEAADPALDHLPQVLGDPGCELVEAGPEGQPASFTGDPPLDQPVLDQVDDEERVAVGTLVEQARQAGDHRACRKARGQVLSHRDLAEEGQRELRALPARVQLLSDGVHGGGRPGDLGGPIRSDHEQSRRFPPSRQTRQQVQG